MTLGVVLLDWRDAREDEAMGPPEQVFSLERVVGEIVQNRLLVAQISWFCAPSVLGCVVQVVLLLFQTYPSFRRKENNYEQLCRWNTPRIHISW